MAAARTQPPVPASEAPSLPMRPPRIVMRLERMGSFHQTRLSFMRVLLRRIAAEGWRLRRERFDFDDKGIGTAVYAATTPRGTLRLVAFGHELAPDERTDRVIAEKWDATFALTTAEADAATLARLRANVPLQEAGRCSAREYVLCRANKSVRLFDSVLQDLAAGRQPSLETVLRVGYLMRTTAVYGNGKFGLSDLANTFAGGIFSRPFEAEMLAVYLVREYTFDLVAHLARCRAPARAVALDPASKRRFGIGNATGLGMAPFLIGHPLLIDRWMTARETAIARVRAVRRAGPARVAAALDVLDRAIAHLAEWSTEDPRQAARIAELRREMPLFRAWLREARDDVLVGNSPWAAVFDAAARKLSLEGQELVNSVVLEPYGDLIDDLADEMAAEECCTLDPLMTVSQLRSALAREYDWALSVDYDDPDERHRFWYASAEKLEPRLGERFAEPGAERELHIGVGRDVKRLYELLDPCADRAPQEPVARFLLRHPDQRHIVRRAQAATRHRYAEIHDNLLARRLVAVDLLRCKLSMFGAVKFDPKSDRWTRINMYQGAPAFADLNAETADDWAFPVLLRDRAPDESQP